MSRFVYYNSHNAQFINNFKDDFGKPFRWLLLQDLQTLETAISTNKYTVIGRKIQFFAMLAFKYMALQKYICKTEAAYAIDYI